MLKGQAPSELLWENEGYNVGVVVAAEGYPGDYLKGMPLPDFSTEDVTIYYAGIRKEEGNLVGSGGRIYLVESSGKTLTGKNKHLHSACRKRYESDILSDRYSGKRATRKIEKLRLGQDTVFFWRIEKYGVLFLAFSLKLW